jgi:hypothetical protein
MARPLLLPKHLLHLPQRLQHNRRLSNQLPRNQPQLNRRRRRNKHRRNSPRHRLSRHRNPSNPRRNRLPLRPHPLSRQPVRVATSRPVLPSDDSPVK